MYRRLTSPYITELNKYHICTPGYIVARIERNIINNYRYILDVFDINRTPAEYNTVGKT